MVGASVSPDTIAAAVVVAVIGVTCIVILVAIYRRNAFLELA
jgi:hypothetical protein